ncbi:hypothetical protein CDAR_406021 [Caerostris darwini]|uniref:Uncharacterized protein n=1 Tax=Caerostris darwini TaxID=1538125 RepID=A0AAV4TQE7_9ARAC|nr:hypothetical protein CDAR_406021 [Caerostris darwini]
MGFSSWTQAAQFNAEEPTDAEWKRASLQGGFNESPRLPFTAPPLLPPILPIRSQRSRRRLCTKGRVAREEHAVWASQRDAENSDWSTEGFEPSVNQSLPGGL